ncbi:MAG: sugar kinase [Acidobacteria bacterium]|nr:sugar kinase [Acidobacteriota bacterium]
MSILAVGSVAYDTVKTPFGEVEEVLGGSATYFSVAASYFSDVAVVAVVGEDFAERDLQVFRDRGVDVDGLERAKGKTFRWSGEYDFALNDCRTLDTQLNVFGDFKPRLLDKHRDAHFLFLGNISPDLQRSVLRQVRHPKLVVCDTMNFWIEKEFNSLFETLKLVDILIINDGETRQLANEPNLYRAGRKILSWGPKALVIKRGEYGAIMMNTKSIFGAPAFPLEDVFDPTGAGDSFAGGFVGFLAGSQDLSEVGIRKAIVFGSVMASFDVEKFSLDRLKELTFPEVQQRYKEFKQLTHFEDIE